MEANIHDGLIGILEERFGKNRGRHQGIDWTLVRAKLAASPEKVQALHEMERTGEFLFCDCSPESPIGRRSLCYDSAALDSRKENKPGGSASGMASAIGIEMLTEQRYRERQKLGEFDRKTSIWVKTPAGIRELGGAVFVYHNGAESYDSVRGFRGMLKA